MADENICLDECQVKINIEDVEVIYDSLSKKIYVDMDKQYKEGKMNGATYAETWAKLMAAVVSGSLNAVVSLQNKETAADRAVKGEQVASSIAKTDNETCIAASTCALNAAKTKAEDIKNGDEADGTSLYGYNKNTLQAQKSLYERQKTGFDDNARQKLLDSQINAWSITFTDGSLITVPDQVTGVEVDKAVKFVKDGIGDSA